MSTPETFHLFPALPSELRLKIWGLALSVPRTVDIRCRKLVLDHMRRFAEYFPSSTPPPSPLHVCQESRHEALSFYTRAFNTNTYPSCDKDLYPMEDTEAHSRYTYINFRLDTIRCPDRMLVSIVEERASIRWLALKVRDAESFMTAYLEMIQTLKALEGLSLLVCEAERGGRREALLLRVAFEREPVGKSVWERPHVVIQIAGAEDSFLLNSNGDWIPGWKEGDPISL